MELNEEIQVVCELPHTQHKQKWNPILILDFKEKHKANLSSKNSCEDKR